jgi:hypothetical protein
LRFLLSKDVKNNRIFFGSLYRAAGLHYYARSLFSQAFDCEFFVPRGKMKELDLILKKLEEMKIVKNPIARKIDWKEILMMKTEYYDYENGQWDVDFSRFLNLRII